MNPYKVIITTKAKKEIIHALDYIEYMLLNSNVADKLQNEIEATVKNISENPFMYPLEDDLVLEGWQIRVARIHKYLLFYQVNTEIQAIQILYFTYQRRDWISILKRVI